MDVPVIQSSPINLATEYRTGFEFTLNYSPYKWWKLNSNFNFFRVETQGDFTYTNLAGDEKLLKILIILLLLGQRV